MEKETNENMKNTMVVLNAIYLPYLVDSVIRTYCFDAKEGAFICSTEHNARYTLKQVSENELFEVMLVELERNKYSEWCYKSKSLIPNRLLLNENFMKIFELQTVNACEEILNSRECCFNCLNNKHSCNIEKSVKCDFNNSLKLFTQNDWCSDYRQTNNKIFLS